MLHPVHPELCRQLAAERHAQLLHTAHVARLARAARSQRQHPRRHRRRH